MNKLVQLISGIVMVALSIGILVYVYLTVLPAESVKSSKSTVKIIEDTNVIDKTLVQKIKSLNLPANVPVTVSDTELSKDNPFSKY